MEENKVVLKLGEYIDLIKENESLKHKLENKERNYTVLCKYAKAEVRSTASYHLRILGKDFNLEDIFIDKLQDYHYKNIADEFIKIGITYDLIEKLTDELVKEREVETNE